MSCTLQSSLRLYRIIEIVSNTFNQWYYITANRITNTVISENFLSSTAINDYGPNTSKVCMSILFHLDPVAWLPKP